MEHWNRGVQVLLLLLLLLMVVVLEPKQMVRGLGIVAKQYYSRGILLETTWQRNTCRWCSTTAMQQTVNENDTEKYHTITWEVPHNQIDNEDDDSSSNHQGNIVWQARHGELLRTAALRVGKTSPHNGRANLINCRGLGTCGTCAVELLVDGNAMTMMAVGNPPLYLHLLPGFLHRISWNVHGCLFPRDTENPAAPNSVSPVKW
jgi:hypothetical protein